MKKILGILLVFTIVLSLLLSSVLGVIASDDFFGEGEGTEEAADLAPLGYSVEDETDPPVRQVFTVIFNDWDGVNLSTQQIQYGEAAVAPAAPVRAGYRFTAWDGDYSSITANAILTALYEPLVSHTITINYVRTDYTMVSMPYISTVISGLPFHETVSSPMINGYQPDQSSVEINEASVTGDINRYVYYTPAANTPYQVRHLQQDLAGNTYTLRETENLSATTGTTVTAVSKNYAGFSAPSAMPSAVLAADGSTVIDVKYTRNAYTIYFNGNGGTYTSPITKLYDAAVTAPANPTRAGYQFTGWSTPVPAKMPANNLTLTAQWVPQGPVNYSIVHWLENTSGTGYDYVGTETKTGLAGSAVAVPTAPPAGITFPIAATYFTLNATKTNNEKPSGISGDGSTILNVYYTRNVYTLSFVFDANKYTLTVGGTTYTTSPYQFSAKLGADISAVWPSAQPDLKPGKTGDGNFTGWVGAVSKTNYVTRQLTLATNHIGDLTMTAGWSTSTKLVTVHYWFQNLALNGYVENYTQTISINSTSTSFNAKSFPGFTVEQTPVTITGADVSFRYTRNKYTLSFYNGGTLERTNPNILYQAALSGENYTPTAPLYLSSGYTFAGWYTTQQGYDNSKINFSAATMPANNLILYARWDKQNYTVSFDPDNGQSIPAQTVPYQGTATQPPAPTKAGYTFVGWLLPGESLNYVFDYPVTQNLSLKASWIANDNISYDVVHDVPGQAPIRITIPGKRMGETVTANALVIAGYLPDTLSKSLRLAASGNEIVFHYTALSSSSYKVKYLQFGTNTPLLSDKDGTTAANQITEAYKPITGYYPDAYQKTLAISQNAGDNVITFYYMPNPNANYTVNHYKENLDGTYTMDTAETQALSAAAGALVAPTSKSFAGYSFNAGISSPARVIASNGSTVFSFYYDRLRYSVNFTADVHGSLVGQATFGSLRHGSSFDTMVTVPAALPEPGYTSTWNPALPAPGSVITQSQTYTANFAKDPAKWTTVIYDSNNGSFATKTGLTVLTGSASVLAANTFPYANHTFLGWNTQQGGTGTMYGDGATITMPAGDGAHNLTLYAQWVENTKYAVSYYANRGTGSTIDQTRYFSGDPAVIKANAFTRPGYLFTDWNTKADGSETTYSEGQSITIGNASLSLYAQWSKDASQWAVIHYDKNNPSAVGSMADTEVLVLQPYTVSPSAYALANHDFNGWSTAIDGSEPYAPGDPYTPSISGTVTFYAQWTEHAKHTVSYYENHPGNGDPSATTKYVQGSFYAGENIYLLGGNLFGLRNYTLTKWNTSPDGTGTSYPPGTDIPIAGALDLYAIWQENEFYQITYKDTISGQIYSDPEKYYSNNGSFAPATVKALMFSQDGYTFTGWDVYEGSTLSLQNVQPGVTVTTLTTDAEFQAQWKPIFYAIGYDLDGGSVAVANPTAYTIESSAFSLYNPTKQGYRFAGWIGTGISTPQIGWSIAQGSTGDRSYTATWEKVPADWSTLTFASSDSSQGSLSGKLAFEGIKGTAADITPPAATPAPGYLFDRWDTAIPIAFPDADTTISALWKKDPAQWTTIAFANSNPLFGVLSGQTLFDGVIGQPTSNVVLPQPQAMAGYAFSGWSAVVPANYSGAPLVITANWIKVDADWSTIIFDAGDTTMGALSGTTSFAMPKGTSTGVVVIPTPVAKPGYSFTGWSTPLPASFPDNDLIVTALWQKEPSQWSTITYDPGNGSMGTVTGTLVFEGVKGSSTAGIVSEPTPTANDGYLFTGWSSAVPSTFPSNNNTIFANWSYDPGQWASISFGVSDPAMGSLSGTSSYTGVKGSSTSPTVVLPAVTLNPGYMQTGWSAAIPANYPGQSITIIANLAKDPSKWSTLTFSNNDISKGTLIGSATLEGLIGEPINLSGVPTPQPKPGYQFKEWQAIIPANFPATNETYSAVWEEDPAQWSSIRFVSDNLSEGDVQGITVYRGVKGLETGSVQFPATVPQNGYQFKQWSVATIPGRFPQTDLVIQASWELLLSSWSSITFVTGNAAEGTLSGTLSFSGVKGSSVPVGMEPGKIPVFGYQFKQWDAPIPSVFPLTNEVITAEWEPLLSTWSTVIFSAGPNAKGTLPGQTVFSGPQGTSSPAISAPTPTPFPGYLFHDWDSTPPTAYPSSHLTVNAIWKKDPDLWATITFLSDKPDQGTLSGTYQYEGIHGGDASGIALPTPHHNFGYVFDGWETTGNSNWTLADLGGIFPSANLVVTAKWRRLAVNWSHLSFVSENIQHGIISGQNFFEGIKGAPLPASAAVPGTIPALGYKFSHWSVSLRPIWTPSDMPSAFPQANLVITAHWEKDLDEWSKIKFVSADPLQGILSSAVEYDGIKASSTAGLLLPGTSAKPGYRFSHWSATAPIVYPLQDLTIYAYWIKDIDQWSTIRFESDPLKGNLQGLTSFEGIIGTAVSNLVVPTPLALPDYQFAGWDITIPSTYPNQTIVIRAQWTSTKQNQSSIRFVNANPAGGRLNGTSIFQGTVGTPTTAVVAPVPAPNNGYIFSGWDTRIPAAYPGSDLVITGSWKKLSSNSNSGGSSTPDKSTPPTATTSAPSLHPAAAPQQPAATATTGSSGSQVGAGTTGWNPSAGSQAGTADTPSASAISPQPGGDSADSSQPPAESDTPDSQTDAPASIDSPEATLPTEIPGSSPPPIEDLKPTKDTWVLLNYVILFASLFMAVKDILLLRRQRKSYDSDGKKKGKEKIYEVLSLVSGVLLIIFFILTLRFGSHMIWFDKWTLVLFAISIVQGVVMHHASKLLKKKYEKGADPKN